jgi:hypothetical protein
VLKLNVLLISNKSLIVNLLHLTSCNILFRDTSVSENVKLSGAESGDLRWFNKSYTRQLLKDADVALIPVGGTYTYDADQALELIKRTSPKIAVPMHYRSAAGFGLSNIGTIEDFMVKAHNAGLKVRVVDLWFYDTDEYDMGECVLAIRPENI